MGAKKPLYSIYRGGQKEEIWKQELYPAWDTFLIKKEVGAGDEARTRYLHLGKVALYRMSYARIMVPPVGVEPTTRGFSIRCSTN